MSSNKTLALALCFAITGCAQTPQNDAEGGSGWWPFGASDKVVVDEGSDTTLYDSPTTELPCGFGRPIDDPDLLWAPLTGTSQQVSGSRWRASA